MKAISAKGTVGTSRVERLTLVIVAAIFLLVGSGVFVFFTVLPLRSWSQAQHWESVPCTILSSSVASHSDSDGVTYSVDISYAYQWSGERYESDAYNFFSGSSSGRSGKEAIVGQYPPGSEHTCFVNPEDPREAVLNRDFDFTYFIGTVGLIFVFIALGLIVYSLRGGDRSSRTATNSARAELRSAIVRTDETVTLKSDNTGLVGCAFFFVFGLIWNGIVFAMLWGMLREESPGIAGLLFMTPFVLVGLGVGIGVVYYFLALFNPRPELTLSPGTIPLGGAAELGWRFDGSTARIRQLTITLQGVEKATYRRGTSTSTDSSTFAKVVLADTASNVEIREGRVSVAVPEFTAPSFFAPNNSIIWQIHVRGDIRWWPDVNREFAIQVAPLPQEHPVPYAPAEFREV